MKIMHIIGGAEKGGSRTHLITLAKELLNRGIKVEIVCFIDDVVAAEARAHDISVKVFPMKNAYDLRVISKLSRYIHLSKPHLIHTHGVRANFIGRLANLGNDIPLLTTVHSSIRYDYGSAFKARSYHAIDRMTRGLTNQFIAVSDAIAAELIEDGIDAKKITRIYNSLALDFPLTNKALATSEHADRAPSNRAVSPIRQELGIDAAIPLLITVGRLESVKNHRMLLDIFELLKANNIDYHGLIAGDGSLRAELEQLAQDKGLNDRVTFLGFRKDVYQLLKASDIFLLTSTMEGFGITLLEAMAAKIPVIVTDVGGMPEVIRIAHNGYVVPADDTVQFVARVEEILASPELSERLVASGYKALQDNFTPEKFTDNTYRLYEKILNERNKHKRNIRGGPFN